MTTYVSVDIETTGPSLTNNKVISIGFFVGDSEGNKLETKRINFSVDWPVKTNGPVGIAYHDFDKQCWDEFWSKQSASVIGELMIDAYYQSAGWEVVNDYLAELETKYGEIAFVCDNPSFDIAFIDHHLGVHAGRKPMRYSTTGKYRSIRVSDDMFSMLPKSVQREADTRILQVVQHDHNPVNDAHYNYLQLIEALKWAKLNE